MRKFDYFWKSNPEWYYRKDNGVCILKDTAPPEAKKSYEHYREQSKRAAERNCMD